MLISSLPAVHQTEVLKLIVEHPVVGAIRYNTGMASARDPLGTLQKLKDLAEPLGKPVYVDLKAKQLRVTQWADVPYGAIVLNHKIEVSPPGSGVVYFRGDDVCKLREVVNGNEIYVDPLPKYPVGAGQSINILAPSLKIEGGLLAKDHEYIRAALELGITKFMLSFVECREDVQELEEAIARHSRGAKSVEDCEIVFKIESQKGVEFVSSLTRDNFSEDSPYRLMAARDDLQIHVGLLNMEEAERLIAERDPRAICASRLLMGLEQGKVTRADLADIELMRSFGYKHFMFSDGISRDHSSEALPFWQEYAAAKPFEY